MYQEFRTGTPVELTIAHQVTRDRVAELEARALTRRVRHSDPTSDAGTRTRPFIRPRRPRRGLLTIRPAH